MLQFQTATKIMQKKRIDVKGIDIPAGICLSVQETNSSDQI